MVASNKKSPTELLLKALQSIVGRLIFEASEKKSIRSPGEKNLAGELTKY